MNIPHVAHLSALGWRRLGLQQLCTSPQLRQYFVISEVLSGQVLFTPLQGVFKVQRRCGLQCQCGLQFFSFLLKGIFHCVANFTSRGTGFICRMCQAACYSQCNISAPQPGLINNSGPGLRPNLEYVFTEGTAEYMGCFTLHVGDLFP